MLFIIIYHIIDSITIVVRVYSSLMYITDLTQGDLADLHPSSHIRTFIIHQLNLLSHSYITADNRRRSSSSWQCSAHLQGQASWGMLRRPPPPHHHHWDWWWSSVAASSSIIVIICHPHLNLPHLQRLIQRRSQGPHLIKYTTLVGDIRRIDDMVPLCAVDRSASLNHHDAHTYHHPRPLPLSTYLPTYLPTYIHTHIHTYSEWWMDIAWQKPGHSWPFEWRQVHDDPWYTDLRATGR